MATGNDRFGFVVQRAQKLALPAVPDARPDRPDIGDGQDQEKLQALRALHDVGEVTHRLGVADVATEGDLAHGEMLLDQPGGRLCFRRSQAQAGTKAAGDARADDRVILVPALGDVMQEGRHVERTTMLHGVDDAGGKRMGIGGLPAFDVRQDADRPDEMLVHREVMIHVELHHRHDASEVRNKAAQNAGFVHAPQRGLRVLRRAKHFQEDAIGFLVVAQRSSISRSDRRNNRTAFGWKNESVCSALAKNRIRLTGSRSKTPRVGDIEPAIVDAKVGGDAYLAARAPTHRVQQATEPGRCLHLLHLESRAQDRREIADVLGHQEVVLHEALDRAQAAPVGVSQALRHGLLQIEGQPLLGASSEEVEMTAHCP